MTTRAALEKAQPCSFPDCGCAEARLCMGAGGPNDGARAMNLPKRRRAELEKDQSNG